jgi:GNAT superfamily N-acetyltransferase
MTTKEMLHIVQSQLATDLNCSPDDFNKDGFVFCEAKENPGRRPFPRGERHFEMYTMGSAVIVSATPDILPYLREQLDGKDNYEAFSMPFVYGQGICYIPDLETIKPFSPPAEFAFEMLNKSDIPTLYQFKGFKYAIKYDENHMRPDILAMIAKKDEHIIGIAGASDDCPMMWQIGIDVLPDFRNCGLASYLVNHLTLEILNRGKIPYYAAATNNIGSQRVAYRAGFKPAWTCVYRGRFDDVLTEPTS